MLLNTSEARRCVTAESRLYRNAEERAACLAMARGDKARNHPADGTATSGAIRR